MTAHVHDPVALDEAAAGSPALQARERGDRPRWLLPGVAIALVVGALVVAGIVPLSIVVYFGLFGAMIFMHGGGHGHGTHAGHGSAAAADDGTGAEAPGDAARAESRSHGCH